ncbi:MAG: hypothetical protein KDA24_29720 [Deltaproteobacteria bacterium]|nr:hypothetical protein [Deltaproteobacteria bacterium]
MSSRTRADWEELGAALHTLAREVEEALRLAMADAAMHLGLPGDASRLSADPRSDQFCG